MLLDLTNLNKSDIKYKVHNYPDGHKHLQLETWPGKHDIDIKCRITNGDDLFLLLQAVAIVKETGKQIKHIDILYLLAARCDWRFSWGEFADVDIVMDLIENYTEGISKLVWDPHCKLLRPTECKSVWTEWHGVMSFIDLQKYQLCFPDKGAKERLDYITGYQQPIVAEKQREGKVITNKIVKYPTVVDKPILVIDDLCDGGGTFLGLYDLLQGEYPNIEKHLFVTHAIQKEGIEKVAGRYNHVYITNSYKDWQNEELPSNVTVIEL